MSKRIDDILGEIRSSMKIKPYRKRINLDAKKRPSDATNNNVAEPALATNTLSVPTAKLGADKVMPIGPSTSGRSTKRPRKITSIAKRKRPPGDKGLKRQKRMRNAKLRNFRANLLPYAKMSADDPTLANDKDAKGLWGCETIEAVEAKWQKWNEIFQRKVLSAFKRQKIPDAMLACVLGWFDGRATSSTISTGDRIRGDAWRHLQSNLAALAADDPDFQVVFVTIIAGTGATSHNKPVIDLHSAQSKAQVTLRAMSPNFFAVSELALFNSTSHPDGGQLIQEHTHALVFGVGALAKAREVAARHMPRFTPNATNAPQIVQRTVEASPINLARICAYMFKAPHRSMTWCPPRDGKKGHMHHSEKGDRYTRYLRMAMIRAMLTIEDVTFAGGEGQRIRSQIIKMTRPRCMAEAPPCRRLLHPDAIGAFCVDLSKALRKADWSLPVINRQK